MQVNIAKIKGLMAEHGDTQKDLAAVLGCCVTSVGNYLTGKSQMKIDDIGNIAQHYQVDAFELLKKTED